MKTIHRALASSGAALSAHAQSNVNLYSLVDVGFSYSQNGVGHQPRSWTRSPVIYPNPTTTAPSCLTRARIRNWPSRVAYFRSILQANAHAGLKQLYATGGSREAACVGSREEVDLRCSGVHTDCRYPATLEMIGELYSIEADIRGRVPNGRLRFRQEKSKPLLAKLEATVRVQLATLTTKSVLSKTINYSLNHCAAPIFDFGDGRVEIRKVLAEIALRCVARGRKNYLFVISDSGGEVAATI
ncbi:hypothetical protein DF018_30320 [Burkholderia cenocepacia]|nr:hypothetical protein DF018_30320 [Burkholderia cenocepacia]